ncbi:MAG: hypothetical protein ABR899_06115, partial [Candidatus Krumholzibacteriaceae bacterium]
SPGVRGFLSTARAAEQKIGIQRQATKMNDRTFEHEDVLIRPPAKEPVRMKRAKRLYIDFDAL